MKHRFPCRSALAFGAALFLQSCGDSTGIPELALEINPTAIELASARDTTIRLRNSGAGALGPIEFVVDGIRNSAGTAVTDVELTITPRVVPTLNPGDVAVVALEVRVPDEVPDDSYSFLIQALVRAEAITASAAVNFTVTEPLAASAASVTVTTTALNPVPQGDPIRLAAEARDAAGDVLSGATIRWTVSPIERGFISTSGDFVGYSPGSASIIARLGAAADTIQLTITARGLPSGTFTIVGHGDVDDRFTSDLWVHGPTAYTGTWGQRAFFGNRVNAWDVTDPANPILASSTPVEARTVNDVKIRSDGVIGVVTHEGSNDLLNGASLMDLSDPLNPVFLSRTTETLQTGVHNAWIEGNYVYLVVDGTSPTSGLRILDISDPTNPQIVASFYGGGSFLHDVYLRDGLAFLSHWNAGLIILDVGNGMAGGSPTLPVEVGRVATQGGQTHNAWYWPETGYVFVGEEDFGTPGIMHVVDASDLWNPREIATFRVQGTTPHNFWMDEDRAILYLSWYHNGIRALDVSGELLGELDRQGREIAGLQYADAGGAQLATRNWAPQLHNGLIYLADLNSGLWVVRPEF